MIWVMVWLRQQTGSLPEADRKRALDETEMDETAPSVMLEQRLAADA